MQKIYSQLLLCTNVNEIIGLCIFSLITSHLHIVSIGYE